MKRIKIVGLCLVAVFAMTAFAASAAQANPTYFKCVKKKDGNYSAKGCPTSSKVAGTGKYERESAVGTTYSSKTGTATLSTPDLGGKVVCSKSKDTGKITGESTDEDTVTFEKCTTEGKKCTSAGESAGKIKTNTLFTELVEVEPGVIGVKFTADVGGKSDPAADQAEFNCEGLLIRTHGFTIGTITSPAVGTGSKSTTVKFAGEEELRTEVSIDGGVEWIGEEFGGFPSEELVTATDKNGAELGAEI
jgi:hypothetical protein